ncbi:MAG: four helix bundle suffix domain-containing protein [Prevotella sp.]|nr:four helix bundle suffix domain-containing protein [Prevotella sp.]
MNNQNWNNQNNRGSQNNQNTQNNQSSQSYKRVQAAQNGHLFLPQHGHYRNLRVYQMAEALYDLTYIFCKRFLPPYGDRTVDQMVQAARSGKQNIAEGNQAAATSSETEIKLTNVARASLEELLTDYEDYLRTRALPQWTRSHPRFNTMRSWARSESFIRQYAEYARRMSDEELANLGITLCHQTIYMLGQLLKTQQERFVTQGGIKERMHSVRSSYRQEQEAIITALKQENASLRRHIKQLEEYIKEVKG